MGREPYVHFDLSSRRRLLDDSYVDLLVASCPAHWPDGRGRKPLLRRIPPGVVLGRGAMWALGYLFQVWFSYPAKAQEASVAGSSSR